MEAYKILIVLTSNDTLGDTGKKTGYWIEEFAAPYYVLSDAGAQITLATPKGGTPPIDPASQEPQAQTKATHRFDSDEKLKEMLAHTKKLSEVNVEDYDAIFYPGGHGLLWDLVEDKDSVKLIEDFYAKDKPISFVCHAPAILKNVKSGGEYLVKGKKVTGFTNEEEEAVQLTKVVPFLVEDMLKEHGANYSKEIPWMVNVEQDGILITGQNPASSELVAKELLELLKHKKHSTKEESTHV